jgi:hypothetical protein
LSTLVNGFKWVMVVAGVLTCTMFYAALFPVASLQSNFGEAIDGPLAQIVVRNWGVLIGLVGLMLIYGAFSEANRRVAFSLAQPARLRSSGSSSRMGSNFCRSRSAPP